MIFKKLANIFLANSKVSFKKSNPLFRNKNMFLLQYVKNCLDSTFPSDCSTNLYETVTIFAKYQHYYNNEQRLQPQTNLTNNFIANARKLLKFCEFRETFKAKTEHFLSLTFMIITKEIGVNISDIKHPVLLPCNLRVQTERSGNNKRKKVIEMKEDKNKLKEDDKGKVEKKIKEPSRSKDDEKDKGDAPKAIASDFLRKHFRTDCPKSSDKQ